MCHRRARASSWSRPSSRSPHGPTARARCVLKPCRCATATSSRRPGFLARDVCGSSSSRSCPTSSRSSPRPSCSPASRRSAPISSSPSWAWPVRPRHRRPACGTGARCCAKASPTTLSAAGGGGGGRRRAFSSPCSGPASPCSTSASMSSSTLDCARRVSRARRRGKPASALARSSG